MQVLCKFYTCVIQSNRYFSGIFVSVSLLGITLSWSAMFIGVGVNGCGHFLGSAVVNRFLC